MTVMNGSVSSLPSVRQAKSRKVSRHRVRESIRRMIVDGRYEPGSRLVQGDLARQLDVSRGVVREAMLELQAYGLVQTVDNRGAMVRQFDKSDLIECYEMREMLEALGARRCCDRITARQLRELRDMAQEVCRLHAAGQSVDGARLDNEFHSRLLRIAGHRLLERVSACYWMLGKVATGKGVSRERTRDSHLAILQAIESGDRDAAERAMREHIRYGWLELERLLADESFVLEWIV